MSGCKAILIDSKSIDYNIKQYCVKTLFTIFNVLSHKWVLCTEFDIETEKY